MKIGCEAYIRQTDTITYHVITVDEATIETKCGITDLRIYWYIREGELYDVNCPKCASDTE
jgi:hypothetical protein